MKKILLVLSIILLCISMICSWFINLAAAVLFSIACIALIAICILLLKNYTNIRWVWIIIVVILSIGFFFKSVSNLTLKGMQDDIYEKNNIVSEEKEECKSEDEEVIVLDEEEKTDSSEKDEKTAKETAKTETVVVEKIVEKKVEVPIEKVVEKTVTEYVEVPVTTPKPESTQTTASSTVTTPQYGYNYNYNYGDPTAYGYNYGYDYNYYNNYYNGYGDPTVGYNNYYSGTIKIKGEEEVTKGETVTYTISGVNSISRSNLHIPSNLTYKISGNKVYITFEEVGWYEIGYGNATLAIEVSR